MIHKNKSIVGQILALLALTSLLAGSAWAQQSSSQCLPFIMKAGGSGSGCPGVYTGYAKMTNSIGSFWITPPTNTISGTLTNATTGGDPFAAVACVQRKNDVTIWCDTNCVTFPATNTAQYQLVIYAKSTPPPTNGQPILVQITWQ